MARIAKYPEHVNGLISKEDRDRLDALEKTYPVSFSRVLREAIHAGLPSVEARYAAGDTDPDEED